MAETVTEDQAKRPAAATHHARLLGELRGRILSGEWGPGTRIPHEEEMARLAGVSRMTMNKVLTELSREGYLERRRKAGTFVTQPRVQSAVLEITDIEREISQIGRHYSYRLIDRQLRPATAEEASQMRLPAGASLLALTCWHGADAAGFCLEERLINLAAAPAAEAADFTTIAPGAWLLRQIPWSGARHIIRAVGARGAVARHLDLKAGSPCLEVERTTHFDGATVTQARLTYPADQHQFVADFQP